MPVQDTVAAAVPAARTLTRLNSNQIKGFWAAWGGWTLDGMDAFIYALVLVPALTELLPRSGVEATAGNIGYYGSVLQALFLLGWGLSMAWGPIADRFGRVRALILTILFYSVFTFLCGVVTNIWQLAVLRILCGIGLGGEQPMGGTFVAEEWPEDRRKMGAGYMHTGYYFGFFLAALANYLIGARYGWRVLFMFGGVPALLVSFIRYGVHESARWEQQLVARRKPPTMRADRARLASYGTMVLSAGTILGCIVLPPLAERFGRRLTMAMYFALMFLSIAIGFGYVFYLTDK